MHSHPQLSFPLSVWHRYLPHHTLIEYPQSIFLPQCQLTFHSHAKRKASYISTYTNALIAGQRSGRRKILDRRLRVSWVTVRFSKTCLQHAVRGTGLLRKSVVSWVTQTTRSLKKLHETVTAPRIREASKLVALCPRNAFGGAEVEPHPFLISAAGWVSCQSHFSVALHTMNYPPIPTESFDGL